MRLLIRRKMILITVSSLLNHFTIIVRFIHRSKYLFVPGKRRGVVLLAIESDFNASAQFANLFVAVTIESTF